MQKNSTIYSSLRYFVFIEMYFITIISHGSGLFFLRQWIELKTNLQTRCAVVHHRSHLLLSTIFVY